MRDLRLAWVHAVCYPDWEVCESKSRPNNSAHHTCAALLRGANKWESGLKDQ